ncbi:MAG: hypothetical protein NZM08_06020 [Chitinophagales bacterium]|nr:hypothetical protein [Chitinophagales bacterium]
MALQTADSGYIFLGTSVSIDGDVSGNHGGGDIWVVKLNSAKGIQWQKCLGGSNQETPYSLIMTSDGGHMIAGLTLSNNGNVSGNHGSADAWVVKLDMNGNIQWQKCYGGTNWDEANSVIQTADGGYLLACSAYSNDGDVSGHHVGMISGW